MKPKAILTFTALTISLCFTACNSKKDKTAQLEDQVAQLEQQIQDLQTGTQNDTAQENIDSPSANTSAPAENNPSNTPSAENSHHTEQDQIQQNTAGTSDISTLSSRIQDLEQQINDTTPAGSVQEQREQFNLLKNEIGSIERELDYLDDDLEAQYRAGTLDGSSYREQEYEIELLEDRLDQCEDRAEYIFRIDD